RICLFEKDWRNPWIGCCGYCASARCAEPVSGETAHPLRTPSAHPGGRPADKASWPALRYAVRIRCPLPIISRVLLFFWNFLWVEFVLADRRDSQDTSYQKSHINSTRSQARGGVQGDRC